MNREEMIMAYSRGELDGDLRSELEEHMESCADCGEEAESWKSCIDSLEKTFPDQDPPADMMERILAKTEASQGS
jgi:anti-sigma factor RsiW